MQLHLTTFDPVSARSVRLRVQAPPACSGAALADALDAHFGTTGDWSAGGRMLRHLQVGTEPLVDGAVVTRGPAESLPTDGLLAVVTEGPATGAHAALRRGVLEIGKDAARLCLEDPSLRPVEGRLRVDPDGVAWEDADGRRRVLTPQDSCPIGRSRLTLTDPRAHAPQRTHRGPLPVRPVELHPPGSGWRTLAVTTALPLLIGGLMAWLLDLWMILIFCAMSSAMAAAHWLSRGSSTAKNRRLLERACARDLADCAAAAPPWGARLLPGVPAQPPEEGPPWVRWGRGRRAAHLRPEGQRHQQVPLMDAVPILSRLDRPHILLGPPAVQDALIAQILLAGWEVQIRTRHALPSSHPLLRWSAHPGVAVVRADAAEPSNPRTVLILLEAAPAPSATLPRVRIADPARGVRLPPEPEAITVRQEEAGLRLSGPDQAAGSLPGLLEEHPVLCTRPDGLARRARAELIRRARGRGLAGSESAALLSAREDLCLEATAERWRMTRDSCALVAELGRRTDAAPGDDPILRVDLNEYGPHCVIAGTTGSGKSEFLRALLAGLALRYSPERLSMVLIDFKGGASFGELARLPHVHGLLTDLEESTVTRDLAYLRAELRRREQLFRELGVGSWMEFVRGPAHRELPEPLPELLICVDEFRMLVESLPEAMQQLLRIATVGRSLGVHLVMSTQRPQGAISADIRANVGIDVCLRVASEADSMNVIGSGEAARIPSTRPGAGYLRADGALSAFTSLFVDAFPRRRLDTGLRILPEQIPEPEPSESPGPGSPAAGLREDVRQLRRLHPGTPPVVPPVLGEIQLPPDPDGGLALGPAEVPSLGWQGRLSWRPERHGPIDVRAGLPDQRRWIQHLVAEARGSGLPVYALVADRSAFEDLVQAQARGLDLRGLAGAPHREFSAELITGLLAVLRRTQHDPAPPPPALLIVQGTEKIVEELARSGAAPEAALEELLALAGRGWHLCLLGSKAPPRTLQGLCPNRVHLGDGPRAEFLLSHPRRARDLVCGLAIVEGPLVPGAEPAGLLPPGPGPDRTAPSLPGTGRVLPARDAAAHRRPADRLPRFVDLPSRLRWPVGDAGEGHQRQIRPSRHVLIRRDRWFAVLGVQAPSGAEAGLEMRPGDVVGISSRSAAETEAALAALLSFNPHLDFRVHRPPGPGDPTAAPRGPRSRPSASSDPHRPEIAVVCDAHLWPSTLWPTLEETVDAADAAVMLFDPGRLSASRTPWAARLRAAPCGVVLGPRSGLEADFRAEACPPHPGAPPALTGLLLRPEGVVRLRLAQPVPSEPQPAGTGSAALPLGVAVDTGQQVTLDR
ncbi:hypothetical protein I6H58_10320 [Rothia kristinae]|uniref:FtsK domain-containing protein n=1 Tax=Rothia kristinae TaxID=37923 RepID=A0A7T4MTF8_9MICC|nr:FtsK/SpoIIIE domain-containing protein [Rothia kristinae]QQC59316.1 hypothetical protein I6H58_10320 [Rothia kristinae]